MGAATLRSNPATCLTRPKNRSVASRLISPVPQTASLGSAKYLYMNCSPLLCHCRGDTRQCTASILPSFRAWRFAPYSAVSPLDNLRGREQRQVFHPQTSRLRFSVSELPRLDDLIWLSERRADPTNRVFNAHPWNGGVHQIKNEEQSIALLLLPILPPTRPASGQVCAWWVSYHQIPSRAAIVTQYAHNVCLKMITGGFAWEQIARPRIMPSVGKGVSNDTGKLASHQYSHALTFAISRAYIRQSPRCRAIYR